MLLSKCCFFVSMLSNVTCFCKKLVISYVKLRILLALLLSSYIQLTSVTHYEVIMWLLLSVSGRPWLLPG